MAKPANSLSFAIVAVARSSLSCRGRVLFAQRVALELEAMGVVHDAIEDGVGDGRLGDDVVPAVDRNLAGDQGGASTTALFNDLQQIAALVGAERFEAEVVEDEQADLAEPLHEAWMATVAAGQRELGEQPGDALIENSVVVAAGLVGERAGEPAFADAGRALDDQVLCGGDPVTGDQPLEQRAVQSAGAAVVDVLDGGALAQAGLPQPGGQPAIGALGGLAIEQQGEPLGMAQANRRRVVLEFCEGAGHASQAQVGELLGGGVDEQDLSPSVIVAGTADVGMVERKLRCLGWLRQLLTVQALLENRVDRSIGASADLQPALTGCLEAIGAVLAGQAQDAEASTEALLGMRPVAQDDLDQSSGVGADRCRRAQDALVGPTGVTAMGRRHVLGQRGVAATRTAQ